MSVLTPLINNWIKNSSECILALPWFWWEWETVKRILNYYKEKRTSWYTFTIPGYLDRCNNSKFSFKSLEDDTRKIVEGLLENHESVILIWNSMSSIPILNTAKEFSSIIGSIVLLSPILNPKKVLENVCELRNIADLSLEEQIKQIWEDSGVNISIEAFRGEIKDLFCFDGMWLTKKTIIFTNPNDLIIWKSNEGLLQWQIISTNTVPWDDYHHSISVDHISSQLP